jgi:hypothetical protein
MLGIDGKYEPAELAPSSGGASGTGDEPATTGGSAAIDGNGGEGPVIVGSGGVDAGSAGAGNTPAVVEAGACNPTDCAPDEKCCPALATTCLKIAPLIGCSASSCDDSCPAPPNNGIAICSSGKCAVQCNPGFHAEGANCVLTGAGGAGNGGSPGTGGKSGTGGAACVADQCPACNIAGPMKCCRNDGVCGCSWAALFACY